MSPVIWIILAVVFLIIIYFIVTNIKLTKSKQKVEKAWDETNGHLQNRFNLIPNFIEIVKSYLVHEDELFERITKLKLEWSNAKTIAEKADINNQLSTALKTIMAISESYPELKSNEQFSQLTEELRNSESTIYFSTQSYNDTVEIYNQKIKKFPTKFFATIFRVKAHDLYTASSNSARNNVKNG